MDSRERVLRTLCGEETDRIPSNFRAETVTQEKLFRATGMRLDALCDRLDVDIRQIDAVPPPEKNLGAFYQNHWGERYVYFETEYGPVRDDGVWPCARRHGGCAPHGRKHGGSGGV